jgi:hypothetical protein
VKKILESDVQYYILDDLTVRILLVCPIFIPGYQSKKSSIELWIHIMLNSGPYLLILVVVNIQPMVLGDPENISIAVEISSLFL